METSLNKDIARRLEKMRDLPESDAKKITYCDGDFMYRYALNGKVLSVVITRMLKGPADFEMLNTINLDTPCGMHTVKDGVYAYTLVLQADGSGYEGSRTAEDIVCLSDAEAKKGYATLDVMTAARARKFEDISRKRLG